MNKKAIKIGLITAIIGIGGMFSSSIFAGAFMIDKVTAIKKEIDSKTELKRIKLGEFDKKALPFTDEIENAQTDVKVGTAFEINNFTFNAEVGKEFGKRDREYVTAGFTYTF